MRNTIIIAFIVYNASALYGQEQPKPKIEVKPFGYVSYEAILDTYKSLDSRDGELYFYPLKPTFDANGTDVNKKHQLQMLSLSTRFGFKVTGPDILGAKTSGLIEADFFATKDEYANLLRIRHACMTLKWEKAELLMGQFWHPVIINEVIPSTIAFGAGAPFHSLNRSPQIRFSYFPTPELRISATALEQGYHRSSGPVDAQRNSGLPELNAQVAYGNPKSVLVGASAGYKWLTPRLAVASANTGTHKTVGQYMFSGFAAGTVGNTTIKAEAVYGENLTHLLMIGGYGRVTETDVNSDYDYANLKTLSSWIDVDHKMGKWSAGLFGGYSKLYGSDKNYSTIATYNRNDDLNYIYRVSPRISFKEENLTLSLEYMITTAVYGKTFDNKHRVTSSFDPVSNHRVTLGAKYSF